MGLIQHFFASLAAILDLIEHLSRSTSAWRVEMKFYLAKQRCGCVHLLEKAVLERITKVVFREGCRLLSRPHRPIEALGLPVIAIGER